mmetsp:Transcript_18860/g.52271  ORF Transcript_18860/g.52271 Transcript_18860/m.52271 type:complete len:401 (+) Transcript_18860:128-1330(+)
MPQVQAELTVTVNSVVGRWTFVSENQPPASRCRLAVAATLRSAPRSGSFLGALARNGSGGSGDEKRERLELEVDVGADGTLRASGESRFHFLRCGTKYKLTLEVSEWRGGAGEPSTAPDVGSVLAKTELDATTASCPPGIDPQVWRQLKEMHPVYVGPEHELGEWLAKDPQDFVWAWQPNFSLMRSLWLNACFTLPNEESPIAQCPNPLKRYCLDLTTTDHWLRGKKVKRHKNDFILTVNKDYPGTFMRCRKLHEDEDRGCWITKDLVEALDSCRREDNELKVYSIELWEKSTGNLAAAIMSFSVGDIFHDYTTACMLRDERSPGAILSKVTGHLLRECGYTLWYWGFKNPYMAEYDERYGGISLDNQAFWPRWRVAREKVGTCDLASRIPPGGLDLATL